MKKTVWAVLAALVLAGCGSSAAKWPGEAAVRKGMENIGFFDIPESWTDISETDDPAAITLRYVDNEQDSGYCFMTYSYTAEELSGYDPVVSETDTWVEWEVESITENYGDTLADTTYGTAKVAGYDAQRVDMTFTDDSRYTDVIFKDDAGTLHLLCFETFTRSTSENLDAFVDYVLKSYDTEK